VLAMARARTFARRKIFLCSTPLNSGTSRIEAACEDSDTRRYWVPCPFCDHYHVLELERIRWQNKDPDTAACYCMDCDARIENHHNRDARARRVARGTGWRRKDGWISSAQLLQPGGLVLIVGCSTAVSFGIELPAVIACVHEHCRCENVERERQSSRLAAKD
jgi:phage terminase large subunit GpA-like protein